MKMQRGAMKAEKRADKETATQGGNEGNEMRNRRTGARGRGGSEERRAAFPAAEADCSRAKSRERFHSVALSAYSYEKCRNLKIAVSLSDSVSQLGCKNTHCNSYVSFFFFA